MGDANVKTYIINAAYNHEHGFGSRVDTFKRAHAQQADITMKDVARWYEANAEKRRETLGSTASWRTGQRRSIRSILCFLRTR